MMHSRPGKPGRAWQAALPHVAKALALALTFATSAGGAIADDLTLGRAKAQVCAVCHGPLGISTQPDTPHLAGQPAIYLSAQMKAYRNGTRKHEVMSLMAKPLSDDDIASLATWFSSIRIEAQPPP